MCTCLLTFVIPMCSCPSFYLVRNVGVDKTFDAHFILRNNCIFGIFFSTVFIYL